MIEDFAELIPTLLKDKSGKAFYSGRQAFEAQSDMYVMGTNPGGSPDGLSDETVHSHTKKVLQVEPESWSAYRDESWSGRKPGTGGIQPSLLYLFDRLNVNPGRVPSSNLVFQRSTEKSTFDGNYSKAASKCWPFHQDVIEKLAVRVVVCFGLSIRNLVCRKLGARQCGESFSSNGRRLSVTSRNADGLTIVTLVHPTSKRGYPWVDRRVEDDPTESVITALNC